MEKKIQIIDVIGLAGEVLLHNGAEIFRVQESVLKIAQTYPVEKVDVYVISNGLFISMSENGKDYTTVIKHVPLASIHLGRVAAVNDISRKIVEGAYTMEEAYEKLSQVNAIPFESNWYQIVCAGIGSGSFCYLLGGSLYDSLVALIVGLIGYMFLLRISKRNLSKIMVNILGSGCVTVCSLLLFTLGMGDQSDKIIIGAIMPMLPGVPLVNSIRDFFNSDYISGMIRLINALLVAFSIAIGVGGMLKIWNVLMQGGVS